MVVGAEEELMILIFRDSFMKIFTKVYGINAVFVEAGKELVGIGVGEIVSVAQPGILLSIFIDFSRCLDIGQRNPQGLQEFLERNHGVNTLFHVLLFIYKSPVSIMEGNNIISGVDDVPVNYLIIGALGFSYRMVNREIIFNPVFQPVSRSSTMWFREIMYFLVRIFFYVIKGVALGPVYMNIFVWILPIFFGGVLARAILISE